MTGAKTSEIAEYIAALWKIAAPEVNGTDNDIWIIDSVFDRALRKTSIEMPERFRGALTFAEGLLGLRCRELPDILAYIQNAELGSFDGTTFQHLHINMNKGQARQTLAAFGLPCSEYEQVARTLFEAAQLENRRFRDLRGG